MDRDQQNHTTCGKQHILKRYFFNRLFTALMMTEVGVLTLNENPSFLAPFTKAPSSVKRNEKRYQSILGTVARHLHALYSYRPQLLP